MSGHYDNGMTHSMTMDQRRFASSATRRLLGQDGPFHVEGREVWIENLSCREMVKPLGTPLLVYSSARLLDNIAAVCSQMVLESRLRDLESKAILGAGIPA